MLVTFTEGPSLISSVHIRRATVVCNSRSRASITLIWALGSLLSSICVHAHGWTPPYMYLKIKQILSFSKANYFSQFWPKLGFSSSRFYVPVPQMYIFLDCLGLWKALIHLTECNLIFKLNYFSAFIQRVTFHLGHVTFYVLVNINFLLTGFKEGIIFMSEFYIKLQHWV